MSEIQTTFVLEPLLAYTIKKTYFFLIWRKFHYEIKCFVFKIFNRFWFPDSLDMWHCRTLYFMFFFIHRTIAPPGIIYIVFTSQTRMIIMLLWLYWLNKGLLKSSVNGILWLLRFDFRNDFRVKRDVRLVYFMGFLFNLCCWYLSQSNCLQHDFHITWCWCHLTVNTTSDSSAWLVNY